MDWPDDNDPIWRVSRWEIVVMSALVGLPVLLALWGLVRWIGATFLS